MNRFEGQVVLVTGSAGGIGKASALRMASEGARVVCVDLQSDAVEQTAREISELGGAASSVCCDISDPKDVESLIAQAVETYGQINSLCNIAGILHFHNTHELGLSEWQKILSVNLTGTFLMCQTALPHLLESSGNIVNMSSTAALAGHPWTAAYSASKGGILALTRTLAVEYGRQGVRANSVCPGSIKTAMHKQFVLPDGADESLLQRIMALDTFRGPEAAAAVVAFLASNDAAHVNGEEIRVDGGTLA